MSAVLNSETFETTAAEVAHARYIDVQNVDHNANVDLG